MALNIGGIWPEENRRKAWKSSENFRVYVALILMINILLIPQLWSLLVVRHDLMLVIDNFHITFPVISAVMKCTIMWRKKEAISSIVKEIEKDWLKSKTADEKWTMMKRAGLSRKITLAAYSMIMSMWLALNVLPCFGINMRYVTNFTDPGKKSLPVQSRYFYDITNAWSFRLTFALQAIGLVFASIYFTGVDCFCAHIILHVCGQLENLTRKLKQLGNPENFQAGLSFCVNEHVRIIRFLYNFNNAVNFMLLGHLFIFIVLFCFEGFLFIKVIKDGGDLPVLRFMWLVVAMIALLLQMFVYCLVGEILVMCSEEMYEATCNSEWYILQPNEARMLLVILIRVQPALNITAGNMFPITMATFCTVIKTSASYVSVLLACS